MEYNLIIEKDKADQCLQRPNSPFQTAHCVGSINSSLYCFASSIVIVMESRNSTGALCDQSPLCGGTWAMDMMRICGSTTNRARIVR